MYVYYTFMTRIVSKCTFMDNMNWYRNTKCHWVVRLQFAIALLSLSPWPSSPEPVSASLPINTGPSQLFHPCWKIAWPGWSPSCAWADCDACCGRSCTNSTLCFYPDMVSRDDHTDMKHWCSHNCIRSHSNSQMFDVGKRSQSATLIARSARRLSPSSSTSFGESGRLLTTPFQSTRTM